MYVSQRARILLQLGAAGATVLSVMLSAPAQTDDLILRPVRDDDLTALIQLKTDAEVARYLPNHTPTPDDVALALTAEMQVAESADDTLLWGIQRRDRSDLIGHVSIWPRETADVPRGELIILVAPSAWGEGVGYASCLAAIARWSSRFQRSLIYAAVHPDNLGCKALMRKVGLDHESAGSDFPGIHGPGERVFFGMTAAGACT